MATTKILVRPTNKNLESNAGTRGGTEVRIQMEPMLKTRQMQAKKAEVIWSWLGEEEVLAVMLDMGVEVAVIRAPRVLHAYRSLRITYKPYRITVMRYSNDLENSKGIFIR